MEGDRRFRRELPDDRERVLAGLREVAEVAEANDNTERKLVTEGRQLGMSWEDLARARKRTRSALWQKYHDKVD